MFLPRVSANTPDAQRLLTFDILSNSSKWPRQWLNSTRPHRALPPCAHRALSSTAMNSVNLQGLKMRREEANTGSSWNVSGNHGLKSYCKKTCHRTNSPRISPWQFAGLWPLSVCWFYSFGRKKHSLRPIEVWRSARHAIYIYNRSKSPRISPWQFAGLWPLSVCWFYSLGPAFTNVFKTHSCPPSQHRWPVRWTWNLVDSWQAFQGRAAPQSTATYSSETPWQHR